MRAALLFAFLLTIQADAAVRTWTIARDVYTADGELVALRGNLAYLKIDGRVEEINIERLSATDQNYIASLSLAPILPGPAAADSTAPTVSTAAAQEEMPLPGPPDGQVVNEQDLNAPDLAPAYGGEPIRAQSAQQPRYRFDRYGRIIPPQPGTAANYVAPFGDPRATANPNDRRNRRPPQQGQNNQAQRSQRDNGDDDDGPGILGFRARRLERERASANRSR